jgi:hypothetical protein
MHSMMDAQYIGSAHVAIDDGRMVIIDVYRDDISRNPVTWLKVGSFTTDFKYESTRVTSFMVAVETSPVQLDEAGLRQRLLSLIENRAYVSEVMLAVLRLVALAERFGVPTLRPRPLHEPPTVPEEPTTAPGIPKEIPKPTS